MKSPPRPTNPDCHKAACMIAKRFTGMIAALLRDEEKGDCERESYRIAIEILDELKLSKEPR